MERNLKMLVAYDGTEFHGWQRQADVRTVQEELEIALRQVLKHPLHVDGASRTDSGVHARGQVASVRTTSVVPTLNVLRAVNHRLPADVTILHIREMPPRFHPSKAAERKLYRYRIHNGRDYPVGHHTQRYVWHVYFPLDEAALRAAAGRLRGTHDFVSFESSGNPRENTVRTISRFEVRRVGAELWIDVVGNGFLYNQVRNMVGTLVEIGRGHWSPERMDAILAARDRSAAGPTAPPQGLCLQWVQYRREVWVSPPTDEPPQPTDSAAGTAPLEE